VRVIREQSRRLWADAEQLEELRKAHETLARDRKALAEERDELKSRLNQAASVEWMAELDRLRGQLQLAAQQRDELLKQKNLSDQSRAEAERRYHEMVARGNQIFQKAQQHVEILTQRNTALSQEVNRLREQLAQMSRQMAAAKRESLYQEFGRNVAMTTMSPPMPDPVMPPVAPMVSAPSVALPVREEMTTKPAVEGRGAAAVAVAAQARATPNSTLNDAKTTRESIDEMRAELERRLEKLQLRLKKPDEESSDTSNKPKIPEETRVVLTDAALNQLGFDDF